MTADACNLGDRPGAMRQEHPPTPGEVRAVLDSCRSVAVVGLSDDATKPAYGVSAFLKKRGYSILPVHPKAEAALGEKVHRSVATIPGRIDLVYLFRSADAAPAAVEEAIAKGAKAVWMPEGVVHEKAACRARQAGLAVIMDRCAQKEILRAEAAV